MFDPRCPPAVLATNEIHVWLAELDQPKERLADLAATLTAEEKERAARFRLPEHRDHFIAGRGLLRELLGAYLNRSAIALRFVCGAHGKLSLVTEITDANLYFNLAHSAGRVLYAVARREVGVDLERLNRVANNVAVAERICTPREWLAFQALATEKLRQHFFMRCWTRKEAIVKALGGGLACGLHNFEIGCPEDETADGRVSLCDAAGQQWSVLSLPLEVGWSGAVAAKGADWRWQAWRWS